MSTNGFNFLILSQKLIVVVPPRFPDLIQKEFEEFQVEVQENPTPEYHSGDSGNFSETENGSENTEEEDTSDKMEQTIVKCIFESLDIIQETGASLNTFQDLLVFACHMFCRGRGLEHEDQMIKAIWPHDWETAKMYLVKLGYQVAKEYGSCVLLTPAIECRS